MNSEESDKPFIRDISSNIIRAERAEKDISKIEYLIKVVNDAAVFSIVLKNRGDFEHSLEYIETPINANKEIKTLLTGIFDNIKEKK